MKYYKLHLIRHGLTAGNLQGLYIGSGSDLPLCDEGRAQLKTLVNDFDSPQVPLVFTSSICRTPGNKISAVSVARFIGLVNTSGTLG